jgi:hypothetical protein
VTAALSRRFNFAAWRPAGAAAARASPVTAALSRRFNFAA